MGLMDKNATKKEFDNFSQEVLKEIESLKKSIEYKASDSEVNIKEIEDNVIIVNKNIRDQESIIEDNLSKIQEYKDESGKILSELNETKTNLDKKINEIEEYQNFVLTKRDEVSNSSADVNNNIRTIDAALATAEGLPVDIENIQELIKHSQGLSQEIEALRNHSMDKKAEIDKLYSDIYGQDIEGGYGTERTEGIKDKLEVAYDALSNKIGGLNNILDKSVEDNKDDFEKILNDSKARFKEVKDKLTTLLPGAMAAGLSSAYEEKAESEKEYGKGLNKNFIWSIAGLIVIALIPVGINVYRLITTEATLLAIIKDTPNLLVAILPIYFPILWLAYSSNKKLNLSKRLIEEYTHKAVLGKTFEGLSTQVDSLSENDNIRNELRTKLLFNLLQVSSENPGKLITDYQTADHPLMEALENSSKLSNSIDKLNGIPGFSGMAKKLTTKKEKLVSETAQKVEEGLDIAGDINE